MFLTFPSAQLAGLRVAAAKHWPLGLCSRCDANDPQGYWLAGDSGVYLTHNGALAPGEKPFIVHPRECDPARITDDDRRAVKEITFGPDDGIDFIEPDIINSAIDAGADLLIWFEGESMTAYLQRPSQKPSSSISSQ